MSRALLAVNPIIIICDTGEVGFCTRFDTGIEAQLNALLCFFQFLLAVFVHLATIHQLIEGFDRVASRGIQTIIQQRSVNLQGCISKSERIKGNIITNTETFFGVVEIFNTILAVFLLPSDIRKKDSVEKTCSSSQNGLPSRFLKVVLTLSNSSADLAIAVPRAAAKSKKDREFTFMLDRFPKFMRATTRRIF